MKDNDKVSVDETSATYAYFEVKDTDGKEISNYGDYKVESSDRTTLMLAADTMTGSNHYVRVIPAKEGTAYIFLKKDDKIVASVPVTVVASRKVTTMTTDKNSFTLSKTSVANEIVSLTTKDQYGNDFKYTGSDGSIYVTCQGAPEGITDTDKTTIARIIASTFAWDGNKSTYTFAGSTFASYAKGTYTFKFTFQKDGKDVCAQVATVNIVEKGEAGSSISYSLNILKGGAVAPKEGVDAVVNADRTENRRLTINVSELLNNVEAKQLRVNDTLDEKTETGKVNSTIKNIYYKVTNQKGDVVYSTDTRNGATVVTGAAFNSASGTAADDVIVDVVKNDGTLTPVYTKLAAGTYTVKAIIVIDPKHATGTTNTADKYTTTEITKSFVITDTSNDTITGMKLKDPKVTTTSAITTELEQVLQFSYDGKNYGPDGDVTSGYIVGVEGYSNQTVGVDAHSKFNTANRPFALASGKTADITKVIVKVAFHNADGTPVGYVLQEVNVHLTVIAK